MAKVNIPKVATTGAMGVAANAVAGVTKAANSNQIEAIKVLTAALENKDLSFFSKASINYAIRQVSTGRSAGRILNAVGRNLGRVITASEARKVLETKLNAKVAQQAIKSNESIQKAAIEAGLWNSGINYENSTSGSKGTEVAPGQSGNTQNGTIGGSFLGG